MSHDRLPDPPPAPASASAEVIHLSDRLIAARSRHLASSFADATVAEDANPDVRIAALATTADRIWADNVELRRRITDLFADVEGLRARLQVLTDSQEAVRDQIEKANIVLASWREDDGHPALWAGLFVGFFSSGFLGLLLWLIF